MFCKATVTSVSTTHPTTGEGKINLRSTTDYIPRRFSVLNQQNLDNGENLDIIANVLWPDFICPWPKGKKERTNRAAPDVRKLT